MKMRHRDITTTIMVIAAGSKTNLKLPAVPLVLPVPYDQSGFTCPRVLI